MKEIGDKLREFFKNKGLTQKEIADRLGVAPSYITKIFNGERGFGEKQAEKWETLFGLSRVFLMTGEGNMEVGSDAEAKPDVPYAIYKELLDRYEDAVRENEQLRIRLSAYEPVEKRKLG